MNRRHFLTIAALSGLTAACGSDSSSPAGPRLEFVNPLRVPPLLHPRPEDGVRRFELTLQSGRAQILPGKQTATWGFNGAFLGPTLRAARGDTIHMAVRNELPEVSTVHWHGMRLPAVMDGGPHQPIEPGEVWNPHWTLAQPATTSWYHPHPHGRTARHMYRGLAGMFIIDDDGDVDLPADYGGDDFPLILQDKKFDADGSFDGDPLKGTFGILGDHHLVNGTYDPRLNVTTERVRLRVLNASNARMYNLAFADRRRFHVIANDGGLLGAPVEVARIALTPGERAELVVAFSPGEQVILQTLDNGIDIAKGDFDLLKFVAAPQLRPTPAPPSRLAALPPIIPPPDATVRRFDLRGGNSVNGKRMDLARIDEVVPAGATEIWEIRNNGFSHNFHIHEVAFQILEVDGSAPPGYATGYKDTVYVPSRSVVKLAVRFGGFVDPGSPYMYHCHVLRHEDAGMMGQYVVVEPGTEDRVPRTIATHAGH